MYKRIPGRQRTAAGIAAIVMGAAVVAAATIPAGAGPSAPTQTPGPVLVPGNPPCPAGLTELKIEETPGQPIVDGTYSDGTLTVTVDVVENEATGPTFNWTSNIGVDVVIVKGGPNANVYTFAPESTGATGLHAPTNPNNGKFFGLSHISWCYDVENGTTTTSSSTSSTTTSSTTTTMPTTTSSSTATTAPPTTGPTTTAPAVPTTVRAIPRPGQAAELPLTGTHTVPLAILGGLLVALGLVLVTGSRLARG